jgi:hypothetical protein
MSITDELRAWNTGRLRPDHAGALDAIADRIDEDCRKRVEEAYEMGCFEYGEPQGFVKLPVDADGETIYIGDRIEYGSESDNVSQLSLWEGGWHIETEHDGFDSTRVDGFGYELLDHPELFHHVKQDKPDSWERIIEDAQEYVTDDEPLYSVSELVERCRRLAGAE